MSNFVKVTNTRQGEFNVHAAGVKFPPGVSYHPVDLFERMSRDMPEVLENLKPHEAAGELKFEHADVAGEPEPTPYESALTRRAIEREKPKPVLPAAGAPPLPEDPEAALLAIRNETNEAVLSVWFDAVPQDSALSDAILGRHDALAANTH